MALEHNQTVHETLEEGDGVEMPRGIFSHWAVYVGMYQCHLSSYLISVFLEFHFTF